MKHHRFWYIKLILLLVLCGSCTNHSEQIKRTKLVQIDLEQSESSSFSSVFDSISWASLEVPSYLFVGGVDKLLVWQSDIYAFDYTQGQALYVFDSSGHFKFSVNDVGPGPDEYSRAVDFVVTEFGIEILDATDKILRYDHRGLYKEKINLPFNCDKFVKINRDEYLLYTKQSGNSSFGENIDCDLVIYNSITKESTCLVPGSDFQIPFVRESNNLHMYKTRTWFSKVFSDSIFGVTDKKISDTLILGFGNKAFPSDLLDINKYPIEDVMSALNSNTDKMYHRPALFENDKYFITSFNKSGQNYLFYDKVNDSWQTLAIDGKSNISGDEVPFLYIHYLGQNSITALIDSNIILDAYDRQKRKNPEIESDFMRFAQGLDINSDPVLVKYWFK